MTQKEIFKMRGYFQQPAATTFSIRNAVRREFSAENLSTSHASDSYYDH